MLFLFFYPRSRTLRGGMVKPSLPHIMKGSLSGVRIFQHCEFYKAVSGFVCNFWSESWRFHCGFWKLETGFKGKLSTIRTTQVHLSNRGRAQCPMRKILTTGKIMIDKMKKQVRQFCLVKQHRLNGLVVWFLLRVQEVPGSNPGWARLFFSTYDCTALAKPVVHVCMMNLVTDLCVEPCNDKMTKTGNIPAKIWPKNSIDIQAELT